MSQRCPFEDNHAVTEIINDTSIVILKKANVKEIQKLIQMSEEIKIIINAGWIPKGITGNIRRLTTK